VQPSVPVPVPGPAVARAPRAARPPRTRTTAVVMAFVWGVWSLLAVGMIAGSIQQIALQGDGTPATITVDHCDTVGGRVTCTATQVIGDLLNGGSVVILTVEGATPADVGKPLAVRISGDVARVPDSASPVVFIGMGIAMLLAMIWFLGLLVRRPASDPFRSVPPTARLVAPGWRPPGYLFGLEAAVRQPVSMLITFVPGIGLVALSRIARPGDAPSMVLLGVGWSVLAFLIVVGRAQSAGVARAFAARWGLGLADSAREAFVLPQMPVHLGPTYDHAAIYRVFRGPIGGGPAGYLAPEPLEVAYRQRSSKPALAAYPLPDGGGELAKSSFSARFRNGGVDHDPSEPGSAARLVIGDVFGPYVAHDGLAAVEVSDGWLFVQAAGPLGSRYADLETFGQRAGHAANAVYARCAGDEPPTDHATAPGPH